VPGSKSAGDPSDPRGELQEGGQRLVRLVIVTQDEREFKTALIAAKDLLKLYTLLGRTVFENHLVRTIRLETEDGKIVKTIMVSYQNDQLISELF
jgi:hypothetical protein